MRKEVSFRVTLVLSHRVTDDKLIQEMAGNIADAIVSHANTTGITPEDSDATTEIVHVAEWHSNKEEIRHV